MLRQNILECIHETPLLKLASAVVPADCANIYAKLEAFNPGGSIKDRICLNIIEAAIQNGQLDLHNTQNPPTVIEATSGNTGIGLALVCAAKKIKLVIVMPENYSIERRYLLKSYGAKLVLTPAAGEMPAAIAKARELLASTPNAIMARQFDNPANPAVHAEYTAREFINDLNGLSIDAMVLGVGTAGTFTGVGRLIRQQFPHARLIAVEPSKSATLSGDGSGVHAIEGIGPGFVPANMDMALLDEIIKIDDKQAVDAVKLLAAKLGVLVGVSSGANFAASLQVAKILGPGKNIITVFPDKGERYFSKMEF